MFSRPVGGTSLPPMTDTATEAQDQTVSAEVERSDEQGAYGADPIARFAASYGMHALLQDRSDATSAGWDRRGPDELPHRDGVPLYDRKKDVSRAELADSKQCVPPTVRDHYDVATTPQSEIDALKNAKCGDVDKLHRLGHTIENAREAYKDLTGKTPPAKVIVTTSAGNGGQPVLIITGPKFDPAKPKTVHTHYHGDNATVADPLGSKAGQNARIRAVITGEDEQAVFVLPEANNTTFNVDGPPNGKMQRPVSWANVSDEKMTTDDALKAAGLKYDEKKDRSVLSMHSGGGMAIVNAMKAHPDGSGLRADKLELYDCVYHFLINDPQKKTPTTNSELYIADWGATASGAKCKDVVFVHGGINEKTAQARAAEFTGAFPHVTLRDVTNKAKEGPTDTTVDPIAKDSDGKTFPRNRTTDHVWRDRHAHNYDPDPHYRTVGQFLGSKSKELRDPPAPPPAPQPKK